MLIGIFLKVSVFEVLGAYYQHDKFQVSTCFRVEVTNFFNRANNCGKTLILTFALIKRKNPLYSGFYLKFQPLTLVVFAIDAVSFKVLFVSVWKLQIF